METILGRLHACSPTPRSSASPRLRVINPYTLVSLQREAATSGQFTRSRFVGSVCDGGLHVSLLGSIVTLTWRLT